MECESAKKLVRIVAKDAKEDAKENWIQHPEEKVNNGEK